MTFPWFLVVLVLGLALINVFGSNACEHRSVELRDGIIWEIVK